MVFCFDTKTFETQHIQADFCLCNFSHCFIFRMSFPHVKHNKYLLQLWIGQVTIREKKIDKSNTCYIRNQNNKHINLHLLICNAPFYYTKSIKYLIHVEFIFMYCVVWGNLINLSTHAEHLSDARRSFRCWERSSDNSRQKSCSSRVCSRATANF